MVAIQIVGGVLLTVGLFLFVYDQIRIRSGQTAMMSAWKINMSGPPALILILVGLLAFIYPTSPWFPHPEDPNPPIATTLIPPVTVGDTTLGPTTSFIEVLLPGTPTGFDIYFDETCRYNTIEWFQDDIENISGWWISIESYDPGTDEVWATYEIDTGADPLILGNVSALCYTDFADSTAALYYYLWIYPYNNAGYAEEPLFVEYADY